MFRVDAPALPATVAEALALRQGATNIAGPRMRCLLETETIDGSETGTTTARCDPLHHVMVGGTAGGTGAVTGTISEDGVDLGHRGDTGAHHHDRVMVFRFHLDLPTECQRCRCFPKKACLKTLSNGSRMPSKMQDSALTSYA